MWEIQKSLNAFDYKKSFTETLVNVRILYIDQTEVSLLTIDTDTTQMAVLTVVAVQLLGIFVSNAKCLQQVRNFIPNLKFEK